MGGDPGSQVSAGCRLRLNRVVFLLLGSFGEAFETEICSFQICDFLFLGETNQVN